MATLTVLRNFVAVAETGEIRAAGARLGRTPSAVSMALGQLEDEVGARLFEGDRKNKLTAVGTFVATQAREVLRHHARASASIRAFARNAAGRVDVACVPSVAAILLPKVIVQFRALAPDVEISLRDTDSSSVIGAVEKGEVGLGIASIPAGHAGVSFKPLFSETLGIVCRIDDPLAGAAHPVPWRALKDHLLLANNFTYLIDSPQAKERRSSTPLAAFTINSALALVRAGIGIAILSRLTVPPWDHELVFLPLKDRKAVRHVGIVTRSEESISPAESMFVTVLNEVVVVERERLKFL